MSTDLSRTTVAPKLIDIEQSVPSEEYQKLTKSMTRFLPRVQLLGSNSKLCQMKKMPQGVWALVKGKDTADSLGESFDCLIVQRRAKALDTSGEKPVTYYDDTSEQFKDVMARSEEKDSGCMWGDEFLIWVPRFMTFATLFCSSKTARNSVDEIKALHGRGCTLGVRLIETKKYTWHGPTVSMCSTPFDIPDREMLIAQNQKFLNPKPEDDDVEDDVSEDEAEERSR